MKRYIRSDASVEASTKDTWSSIKKLLESEFENGTDDPIFGYEAKVGKKILPLMDAVQQYLGVDFDGQFNDGEGVVEFVTTGDDPELIVEGYDFQTFYRKLVGMIMEANSVRDFKQRYKEYLTELIKDTPDYDASAKEQRHNENWRMMNEEHPGWAHRDFTTSSEGHDFIDSLRASDVPYDFIGDGKGGLTVWYPADSDVSSATVVGSEHTSKGPAWIVQYNYDTGSRESGPYPEWNELLIYAPSKEMAKAKFEKDHLDDIPGHYDGCSVRKATKTEIRECESAWAEDDNYQIRAAQTPEYALYQNKKNKNKYIEVKRSADGHSWFRPFVYWNTDQGPVKNYSGSKTNRGRYHRATKDTLKKVLDEYVQVDDVHSEYDDPSDLMSSSSIQAATSQRMTDFQLEHLLELADDMLYQVYDNNRYDDYSKKISLI